MATYDQEISSLFEKGLPEEGNLGLHATSWEMIHIARQTGVIPPIDFTSFDPSGQRSNIIEIYPTGIPYFIAPIRDALSANFGILSNYDPIDVSIEAHSIGKVHAFMKELGIENSNQQTVHDYSEFTSSLNKSNNGIPHNLEIFFHLFHKEEVYEDLRREGHSDEKILNAMKIARHRNGIIVGIRQEVAKIMRSMTISETMGQMKLITPQGLPLEYISGIEPQGDFEWQQFEQMQEEL